MRKFLPFAFGVILATGSLFAYHALAVTLPGGEALFETSLASRISSTDTSMTLVANSSSISGYHCFTIDEGRSDSEFMCGSVTGTAVNALERGISYTNGTTTVTANQLIHRAGADVKITDYPLIQRIRNLLNGLEYIPNLLSYLTGTACSGTEANGTICDKAYIDSRVSAGAANANDTTKGIVQTATGAQAAAGTSLGSTAARLALGANIATSTCQFAANSVLVASSTSGKLDGRCFDTTNTYTFTAPQKFSSGLLSIASSTVVATTSIGASSTSTNALILNGVAYAFPGSNGASSTALVNDSHGDLTWGTPAQARYSYASTTQSTIALNTTLTSALIQIPSGVLTASSTITVNGDVMCIGGGSNCQFTVQVVDESGNMYMNSGALTGQATGNDELVFTGNIIANTISSQASVINGMVTGSSGATAAAPLFNTNTTAISWAGAKGFGLKLICSNNSSATCKVNDFAMTVNP